jgi:hypothetical protein
VFPVDGEEISPAVADTFVVTDLPEYARQATQPAELAPKVHLLAYSLPGKVVEGGVLHLSTWWKVTGQIDRNVMIAFRLSVKGETPRRGTLWYTRHDPGDWTVPLSLLKPGQLVEDRYPARLAGLSPGPCKVYAAVVDTTQAEGSRILGKPHLLGEVEILPREQR